MNQRQVKIRRGGLLDEMVDRRPTDLAMHTGSHVLIYLIHGVTGTPAEMHYTAKGLARHGWDIYVTTLPGHCTRLTDLNRTCEKDWREHVCRQLAFAKRKYKYVFAAGLSAGGLLALDASTEVKLNGVGVLSPTFVYDGWNTPWSHAILPLLMKVVPYSWQHLLFHIDGPPFGIKDKDLQARIRAAYSLGAILREWLHDWSARRSVNGNGAHVPSAAAKGYPIFPLRTLTNIHRLIARVRRRLWRVEAPTIILQACEDDMTSPRNAAIVYDGIASKKKHLVLLDDCYHVITADKQRHAVVTNLADFFGAQIFSHLHHRPSSHRQLTGAQ